MCFKNSFILIFILLIGCSGEGLLDDSVGLKPKLIVRIQNQSQFELHHVYLYADSSTYLAEESFLTNDTLPINAILELQKHFDEPAYRVTVSRQKNKDSELFSYTSAFAFEIKENTLVEYFDDQFRISFLSDEEINQGRIKPEPPLK